MTLFRGHSIQKRLMRHVWLTQVTTERTRASTDHSAEPRITGFEGDHGTLCPGPRPRDRLSSLSGPRRTISSNGENGTLTIIHEDDPDHYTVVANVTTQKSARTMALDPKTHRVHLVAAQFGATPQPSVDQPHPRPAVLDGSFKVMVVGK
jgi:hypothetical protein